MTEKARAALKQIEGIVKKNERFVFIAMGEQDQNGDTDIDIISTTAENASDVIGTICSVMLEEQQV